jgi:hypothetical protein
MAIDKEKILLLAPYFSLGNLADFIFGEKK